MQILDLLIFLKYPTHEFSSHITVNFAPQIKLVNKYNIIALIIIHEINDGAIFGQFYCLFDLNVVAE